MRNKQFKFALVALCLILLWNITAWFLVKQFYFARKNEVVEQKTSFAKEHAGDLADSIKRNLNYLGGIPDLLSQLLRVKETALRFGPGRAPSALPLETRKRRWTEDKKLNELSQFLARTRDSLNVDIIFLLDAGGDCIAASNWGTPETTIGTNFIDREYFKKNIDGESGMQFAVGKTTHVPGLYFSTPVIINGKYLGAVVVKTDVSKLTFLIKELDAFVVDENGIIILARDKKLEMHSLAGTTVSGMSEKNSFARYRRVSFDIAKIQSWGDKEFPSLVRLQNDPIPHELVSTNIPEYDLTVYAGEKVSEIRALEQDESWFIFLLGISGSVLIIVAGGAILYLSSIKFANVALDRANAAERRIISISEETQQRVGQELHDDLGQHLTGVAFMSEVLYKRLEGDGHADAKHASKITALLNEAISKTRKLARGLYPIELKEIGLPAMLERIANRISEIYPIECVYTGKVERMIGNDLVVTNLYRIAQEAVNNAVKHSGATRINITLTSGASGTTLEISDNGSGIGNLNGFEVAGIGMHSMQYRAALLGGTLRVSKPRGGGTSIVVSIPAQ